MTKGVWILVLLCATQVLAQTGFDEYVRSAESRMKSHNGVLEQNRSPKTGTPHGANPHAVPGGQVHHWSGNIFIPGVRLDRVVRMAQDYDHRAQYFRQIVTSAKLVCREGDRYRTRMRLREPAVIDIESDVFWERIDERRWKSRSYSTRVQEVGGDHRYLLRANSYWWFSEMNGGVVVEMEAITLTGQIGAVKRMLGSWLGISPEKSVKQTLSAMRDASLRQEFPLAGPNASCTSTGL